VQGLNGMELGDDHLVVQRASIGSQQASGMEMGVNAMSMLAGTTSTDLEQGRVLQLLNMVTPEELMDNDEYEGTSQTNQLNSSPHSSRASAIYPVFPPSAAPPTAGRIVS